MAAKGEARAKISLDYSGWAQGAAAVKAISQQMFDVVKTTVGVAFGTLAADAIKKFAAAIPGAISEVLKMGEELANMAHATGMAAGQFAAFKLMLEHGISFGDASEMLGRNAELLSNDASIFRDVQIKIAEAGLRIQGFWIGFADKIAPVMTVLLDRFNALDLSKWGQQFAEPIANAVGVIYNLIESGTLWQTLKEGFEIVGRVLSDVFNYAAMSFEIGLTNAFISAVNVLKFELDKTVRENPFFKALEYLNPTLGVAAALPTSSSKVNAQSPFGLSSDTQKMINAFLSTLSGAVGGFGKDAAGAKSFENRYALQNFGVSNLQKIGGGDIAASVSVSVAQQSLTVQRDMFQALNKIASLLGPRMTGNAIGVPAPPWYDSTKMSVEFN